MGIENDYLSPQQAYPLGHFFNFELIALLKGGVHRQALHHQKQNEAPYYYLEILLDGASKPLNLAYEPLNGFELSFSPFFL